MTEMLTSTAGWTILRHGKWIDGEEIEVFVAPDGRWYRRAGARVTEPDIIILMKRHGNPLRLVSIEHWKPTQEAA